MSKRKSKGQFPVAIFIILLLIIVVVIFIAVQNTLNSKNSVDSSKFEDVLKSKNYSVGDATEQYRNENGIKKVTVAIDSSTLYQIDFFELETDDFANNIYKANRDRYETRISSDSNISSEVGGRNWSIYELIKDDYYFYVARIGKTVLLIDAESKYRNEIEDVLKELGYNK